MRSVTNRVLVVFVDALGPAQLRGFGDALAGLTQRATLRGVLGYSSGALATVLTGAAPRSHGRMCLFAERAPEDAGVLRPLAWLGMLPRVVHERGIVRRAAARALARTAGLTGYVALHRVPPREFRWLDLPERDDLFRADSVGGCETFLATARRAGLAVYAAPWQLAEHSRWEHAQRALRTEKPDLAFLYAAELDGALHAQGNGSLAARDATARIAAQIASARDAMARGDGRVTTVIVGDHGMADVTDVVDPRGLLADTGSARVFVDSTMLRVWGPDDALARLRARFERARLPGRWLDREALTVREAPVAGDRYGRAMFVLDEGRIFAPSYVGGRAAGMHGYDTDSPSSRAAFATDSDDASLGEAPSLGSIAPFVVRKLGLA